MNFMQFAAMHGLEIESLYACSRVRRCATQAKPRSKNGAFFWDGERGWVMDWAGDENIHWFGDGEKKPWTDEEKRAWAVNKRAHERQQHLKWGAAASRTQELLNACRVKTHEYLNAKGLPDAVGLVAGNLLVVPMRNCETNEIQGAQMIEWDSDTRKYRKKMYYGMRARGAVLRLGDKRAKETFLVEGYATGLSVDMALRQLRLSASVLICFSDFNLVHVATLVTGRAFVFADNDVSGAGLRAAQKTGFPYCMSAVIGEDANDMHQRAGLMALCSMLMHVRRAEVAMT